MAPHLRLPPPLSLVVHGPLRHATIPLLALAFMAASAVAVLLFDSSKTDLDVFFWPSAEIAVHGHPLLVYTLRAGPYPNANGPVSLLPLGLVAAVINLMNVFNSFPIIWEMTRGGPGYETNTTTVFMYNLKESFIGEAAAMSIVNFALIIVIVLAYLRISNWGRAGAA